MRLRHVRWQLLLPARSECRLPRLKPAPGMLLDAAAELDLDLASSVMVGKGSDLEAARAAGCARVIRFGPDVDDDGAQRFDEWGELLSALRVVPLATAMPPPL
ncbi:MAG: D-glycero-beta-D-manno-heptose 1,7-bisphosphate 7-phosphatase [Myxococcales bacterium]|nr:D-glycero-beta-D-manno-heptose 1,7-bisphosphate 7-phosphatase [Myxococcales bacterium]